jgi:hypothetical protein
VGNAHVLKQTAFRKLSDEQYARAKEMVIAYMTDHQSIANRELRALTQLSYDQAVTFFNKMIADGILKRVGKTTTTRYFSSRCDVLHHHAP